MPLNILLADDSVPAQNMGKKILVDAGYHVQTVSNGLEALRRNADFTPDIVIMDIFMPGYTGLEVCERLRASDETVALPVILTVGKLEPYRPEDGEHVHANAVIVKPFAAAELISAVRSLIGVPPTEAIDNTASSEASAEPLQQISSEAPEDRENTLISSDPVATAEPSQAEVLDELPFYYGKSAIPEDAAPWASQEASLDDTEILLSNVNSGPQSLVFNPDAGPTPFSASVIDLLPSESHLSPEDEVSAFPEFNPEGEAPLDPLAPELKISATKEFSAATAHGEIGADAATALLASEPPLSMAESAIAIDEPISERLAPVELESPNRDVPALDSWMEVQKEAPTEILVPALVDIAAPAEEIPSEVPAQDEEARRQAFEELFNSTEPFPVEQYYVAAAGASGNMPPAVADPLQDDSRVITPDSQMESLIHRDDGFVDPELDPDLMNQEEPVSAALKIPDRDLLLEDSFDDWPDNESTQEPTQAATANSGESYESYLPSDGYPSQPKELSEPMPALAREAEPTEAQFAAVEALPAAPEAFEEWVHPALAEIVEAAPAQPETVSGIVHPGAQQGSPEPMHSEAELHVDEPAPVQEPEAQPAPVEEPEPEPQPAPAPSDLVSAELVESQSDIQVAEVTSYPVNSLQSDEAERIHQAVDRVFDRFKRLLVTAIVRELARHD